MACRLSAAAQTTRKTSTFEYHVDEAADPEVGPEEDDDLDSPQPADRGRPCQGCPYAREALAVSQPRYKLDDTGALVPDVRAEAAIIYNPENGQVLYETNSLNQRSIASITKVMTAVVFLENNPDLTETVVVTPADVRAASTTYLRAGYLLTEDDLLHLMLIASDNAAARVLARVSPYGRKRSSAA